MSYRRPIYERRIERKGGRNTYIVTVMLGGGKYREVVVTEEVYDSIGQLSSQDRRISHQDERHSEYRELSEESLYERAAYKPRAVEDIAIDRMLARQALVALMSLPPVQARRFVLRNVLELSYPEIARSEGCTARAVQYSVELATEKIRKILKL